jgi:hypothetical protein
VLTACGCSATDMKIPEILLVETVQRPGSLASVLSVIADEQLVIEHLQAQRRGQGRTLWEITVEIDEPQIRSSIRRSMRCPMRGSSTSRTAS